MPDDEDKDLESEGPTGEYDWDRAHWEEIRVPADRLVLEPGEPPIQPKIPQINPQPVTISGRCMKDSRGRYLPIGFTMMWAMWGYRHDRKRFLDNIKFMESLGVFDYARILTNISRNHYWSDKSIEPDWNDYDEIFKGTIDALWEVGLRTQVTIFGSAEDYGNMKYQDQRLEHVARICSLMEGREYKVQFVEIANEAYNIGLDSLADISELVRAVTGSFSDGFCGLAATSPQGGGADDVTLQRLFSEHECPANITTVHFDRNDWEENYRHCRQPWHVQHWDHVPKFFSSNEPRNLHETNYSPELIAMDFANTAISGGGTYVMHCAEGVRGDRDFSEIPRILQIANALKNVKKVLPNDIASGGVANHHWDTHPFEGLDDQIWPDGQNTGVVRCFSSFINNEYYVIPLGIKEELMFISTFDMRIDVYNPIGTAAPFKFYELKKGDTGRITEDEDYSDIKSRSFIMRVTPI